MEQMLQEEVECNGDNSEEEAEESEVDVQVC